MASSGRYIGIAPEASLIIVKLGNTGRKSFARTTELMRGIKYILDKAQEIDMPVSINMSYGTNDGSHDGQSLFETYLDDMSNIWRNSIVVASGNEGSAGHHYKNIISNFMTDSVEFNITRGLKSVFLVLWKSYLDRMNVELISPDGISTGVIVYTNTTNRFNLGNTRAFIIFGQPTPYNEDQEIYIELIAMQDNSYVTEGIWTLNITGVSIIQGTFNIWLPITEIVGTKTAFLKPNIFTTLSIPSTSRNVITVGGYNSNTNSIGDFSGDSVIIGIKKFTLNLSLCLILTINIFYYSLIIKREKAFLEIF